MVQNALNRRYSDSFLGGEEDMNRVIARENGTLRLLHSDLYKCALSGSFLLSLLSFFVIPVTLEYGQLHRDLLRGILAADMLFMAAFAIVFAA